MNEWIDDINDIPFYLNCVMQFISFIYVTKVCFVGKCSVIRNIINIMVCTLLFPIITFPVMMLIMNVLSYLEILNKIIENETIAMIFMSCVQLIILAVFTILYLLNCRRKRKNRSLAVFTYLIFYMISLYALSISLTGTGDIPRAIINIIFVCVIQFLFCYYIMPEIVSLSKEKREIHKMEFYLLPAFYIFIGFYLIMCISIDDNPIISQAFGTVFSFTEFLMLITFKAILKNLSQIHEISNQNERLETAKNEIKTLSVEVMEALAHTIDAKDEYTKGHSVRVANYSRMIAQKMGLTEEECENIYYMGLLHDLGKIGVPNEIINSPNKLSDEEYAVIKTHPGLGFDILAEIKSRPDLAIGARWHHERYDGKGYPDGKSGEEIPLMARIIAVADSYDAMTSNRSYRQYMSQDRVREQIRENAGTQFDPDVAKCMLEVMDEDMNYELHE